MESIQEIMSNLTSIGQKTNYLKNLDDDKVKLDFINQLDNDYYKLEVIESMSEDNTKIQAIEKLKYKDNIKKALELITNYDLIVASNAFDDLDWSDKLDISINFPDDIKIKIIKEITEEGDIRLKKIALDDGSMADIDISFAQKTDKLSYTTDMCLNDRLNTIRKQDPEKYKYVIANILLAKKVLKDGQAYKTDRSPQREGGLGGVGVENWILQNGGSFIDAANSFLEKSNGKNFEKFKREYQIWDFGENHLAEGRLQYQYPHDNFVTCNMSSNGYNKMIGTLEKYLMTHRVSNENNLNNEIIKGL